MTGRVWVERVYGESSRDAEYMPRGRTGPGEVQWVGLVCSESLGVKVRAVPIACASKFGASASAIAQIARTSQRFIQLEPNT